MTQIPSSEPTAEVNVQPDVYTVMLIVVILALVVTIAVVLRNLMSPVPGGYGLGFADLFRSLKDLVAGK